MFTFLIYFIIWYIIGFILGFLYGLLGPYFKWAMLAIISIMSYFIITSLGWMWGTIVIVGGTFIIIKRIIGDAIGGIKYIIGILTGKE